MKIAAMLTRDPDPRSAGRRARAYEEAGVDVLCVPEAYGFDAVSWLGYLGAVTDRAELMSEILPIYGRTPALTAMTAAGLDHLSGGRFILGLGASGPQVIEGWHGVTFDAPVGRTREIIDICRTVWRRERLEHEGAHYHLPLPSGAGKPLKLIDHPVRPDIPLYVAALGPANVELVASAADGWVPYLYVPERADAVWAGLFRGARRSASGSSARWRSWPAAPSQ